MQARGFLNYRSKYCWPKVIYCICQPNELERAIKKKTGRAKQGANQKSGRAMAHPGPPLESPRVRCHMEDSLRARCSVSTRARYSLKMEAVNHAFVRISWNEEL